MKEFLRQVAEHYFDRIADGSRSILFVFPNRRSAAFFRKYSSDKAQESSCVIYTPDCIGINDFIASCCGQRPADRISLLLKLYDSYVRTVDRNETLDNFIYWGDVLLSDFSDVDKYMADPRMLFTNIAQIKEVVGDPEAALSDNQRSALEKLCNSVLGEGEASDSKKTSQKFIGIWNKLYDLYEDFRNLTVDSPTEASLYRKLAESRESMQDIFQRAFPGKEKVVFVGLNALCTAEIRILRQFKNARLAEFCWDFPSESQNSPSDLRMKDPQNRCSYFLGESGTSPGFVKMFGQAFEIEGDSGETEFNSLAIPSAAGQAKQLPALLRKLAGGEGAYYDEPTTAVVLADESLLLPVLDSIPEDIGTINVTMGYPLQMGGVYGLLKNAALLQTRVEMKDGEPMFYHKYVSAVLDSKIFVEALDENEAEKRCGIKKGMRCYVKASELTDGADIYVKVFRKVLDNPNEASEENSERLCEYLKEVIVETVPKSPLEKEFARQCYEALNRLSTHRLKVQVKTFVKLFDSLVGALSVPFNGEPLKGLQIMGPLETRALDFKNVIILSCNEGFFPSRSISSSFIPPDVRKGFDLPTYEHQDAVWAYYFYRLIRRASKVWMLYDSRMKGLAGEQSRYIKQLELGYGVDVDKWVSEGVARAEHDAEDAPAPPHKDKRAEDFELMRSLTASSLKTYLDCPLQYYYSRVLGIDVEEEVEEELAANDLGTVFHAVMQSLYSTNPLKQNFIDWNSSGHFKFIDASSRDGKCVPRGNVDRRYIESLIARKDEIKLFIARLISQLMKGKPDSGKDLINRDLILKYVLATLGYDKENAPFEVLGLEAHYEGLDIAGLGEEKFMFHGEIDRIDRKDGIVYVTDYKTGSDGRRALNDRDASQIFDLDRSDTTNGKRNKVALQMYVYDRAVLDGKVVGFKLCGEPVCNRVSVPYVQVNTPKEGIDKYTYPADNIVEMDVEVAKVIDEMRNLDISWFSCEGAGSAIISKTCEWCKYKSICGK